MPAYPRTNILLWQKFFTARMVNPQDNYPADLLATTTNTCQAASTETFAEYHETFYTV